MKPTDKGLSNNSNLIFLSQNLDFILKAIIPIKIWHFIKWMNISNIQLSFLKYFQAIYGSTMSSLYIPDEE